MKPMFNSLLFFPITPFLGNGEVDLAELAAHIERGIDAGAGGVFVACGTGEFSALEPDHRGPRPCLRRSGRSGAYRQAVH
jgi:5-dehydro-4-deoxyglucarate dehydratase